MRKLNETEGRMGRASLRALTGWILAVFVSGCASALPRVIIPESDPHLPARTFAHADASYLVPDDVNREMMVDKKLLMADIAEKINEDFQDDLSCIFNDDNSERLMDTLPTVTASNSDSTPSAASISRE